MSSPVTLSVALAQINATVGDLAGNARLIAQAAREAHAQGAQLVLAPELALTGYPPEDLLLRPAFMAACTRTLRELDRKSTRLNSSHTDISRMPSSA